MGISKCRVMRGSAAFTNGRKLEKLGGFISGRVESTFLSVNTEECLRIQKVIGEIGRAIGASRALVMWESEKEMSEGADNAATKK